MGSSPIARFERLAHGVPVAGFYAGRVTAELRRRGSIPALVLVAAVAGCGGSPYRGYGPDGTGVCLGRNGAVITVKDASAAARGAAGGGFKVTISGKTLNIAFGKDPQDAAAIRDSIDSAGGNAALYVKGNAVLSWDNGPTAAEQRIVDGCLKLVPKTR